MKPVLLVKPDIHARIKTACKNRDIPLQTGTNALLTFALDSLESGEVEIRPVMAVSVSSDEQGGKKSYAEGGQA